jgi:hypothetical protein
MMKVLGSGFANPSGIAIQHSLYTPIVRKRNQ